METQETSRPDDAARADKPASLSVADELARIRARARLLELALLVSFDEGTYLDALIQGAQDVADGLDRLAERLGA